MNNIPKFYWTFFENFCEKKIEIVDDEELYNSIEILS